MDSCLRRNDNWQSLSIREFDGGEATVVFLSGGVVGAGGVGFVGEVAEDSCDAVGGDFCDSASFVGVPANLG